MGRTGISFFGVSIMTFSLHAFSSSDTAFDVQAAALEDPRPHPAEAALVQLGRAMMTELIDLLGDGALEEVQAIFAESLIGAFHSAAGRIERDADRTRDRMRILERDFDGSEMADGELQDATRAARAADVAQMAAELVRDAAAEVYATATGEVWTPWRGSRRGTVLTAAQLEAKTALRAMQSRRQAEAQITGPVVAFRAAPRADTEADAHRIFDALNWARAEWPAMVLATTGAKGAEKLAIRWAQQKGVTLVLARADFEKHGKAAPFRANDELMALELIVSPEHGDRIEDFPAYAREVMGRVAKDLGEPELSWIATAHFDTDQPHAHILVRGRRGDGRDLVIPRAYVGYGIRARAQEVAQERLGDLSRHDAEKRIWRETEANRFTNFDRRLLESRSGDGTVADGVGRGAWAALSRGRLRHLELFGLATRAGQRYQLAPDLEERLRSLQLRTDIIRTLNARRLESAVDIRPMQGGSVTGRVVQSGHHDEIGATGFVIVRDAAGAEHYARIKVGAALPPVGASVILLATERGIDLAHGLGASRGADRSL